MKKRVGRIVGMVAIMGALALGMGVGSRTSTALMTVGTNNTSNECKPLLQSCNRNSECCSDLCLLGLCT